MKHKERGIPIETLIAWYILFFMTMTILQCEFTDLSKGFWSLPLCRKRYVAVATKASITRLQQSESVVLSSRIRPTVMLDCWRHTQAV